MTLPEAMAEIARLNAVIAERDALVAELARAVSPGFVRAIPLTPATLELDDKAPI